MKNSIMNHTTTAWNSFYEQDVNHKPLIPESFIARIFMSHRPFDVLKNYDFTGKKLLDIGCGTGRHIRFFNELGFITTGTEISIDLLNKLRSHFGNTNFINCPSKQMPFESESFSYIVAVNSIYYLETENDSLLDNLRESVRILKRGGVFVCSFVAPEHFILENALVLKNKNVLIKNSGHQCKEKVFIRPMSSKREISELFSLLHEVELMMIGEIRDELGGKVRHLYYLIGEKIK